MSAASHNITAFVHNTLVAIAQWWAASEVESQSAGGCGTTSHAETLRMMEMFTTTTASIYLLSDEEQEGDFHQ